MKSMTEKNGNTTGRENLRTGKAVARGVVLALCCILSYKIITDLLVHLRFVPRDDELLGGMWTMVATIFVFRDSYDESMRLAFSRISATLSSFAFCLVYLLLFPFRLWALAVLIAIIAISLELIGRSEDIITACITTAVVMVVASISPQHAWQQPILRLIDTIVGVVVGLLGVWVAVRLTSRGDGRAPTQPRESLQGKP
jgi:hypothetical protein